jgi:hypothetical protein
MFIIPEILLWATRWLERLRATHRYIQQRLLGTNCAHRYVQQRLLGTNCAQWYI